jgi:hypothetical protein
LNKESERGKNDVPFKEHSVKNIKLIRNSLQSSNKQISNPNKKITKSIYNNDETFADSTKLGSIESIYLNKNNNNVLLTHAETVEELHFIFVNIAKKNNFIKRKIDIVQNDKNTVDYLDMELDI